MRVAVLGTGTMGAGMVRSLLRAGLDVTAWNRTPERAEPGLFLEAIAGGPADTPYAQLKAKEMLTGQYPPSFSVDGVLKDVGLMADAASRTGFRQDLLRTLQELYAATAAAGHGGDDIAAVYIEFAPGGADGTGS